ncbi:PspA/IM30 family protein [Megalodesulfovibrio gigas]|uniref:Putative phage shock protein PspA (IM30) n=1 Tax=Megalodesulfovibrio gigas (strain ATCC 19364 / DSM 1382 / NCIMB 9332 / VKM B-1759) TaxID=1121448 RepID=T2G8T0_MEGG1|nr:PspA/IM30 family protein [Megalodesulfovibrio gigas]AGW12693.1 putative phage shock protein PspA (IM30) [Megalodesulfovibrio gigas DSM 1382 = ATCC 19364]
MSIFRRLFKVGQSEAHAVLDSLEDPIKMTEQGIRDLRQDLQQAMQSLAEVKALALRTRRDADNAALRAADYEKKAILLLQRMQAGTLSQAEAERLAAQALQEKESSAADALRLAQEASRHEQMAAQLQANVNKIKASVQTYENDLRTLKARATTAQATKKINQQLSRIDTSGTIAMLEKMKNKVEQDEALAQAYGDMAQVDKSVDDEINAALAGTNPTVVQSLDDLKRKMGILTAASVKELPPA